MAAQAQYVNQSCRPAGPIYTVTCLGDDRMACVRGRSVATPSPPQLGGKPLLKKHEKYYPPPLSKLRPCLSYSGRRDRINSVSNLIRYEM